ncbi:MAG: hypothetical protein IT285_11780 [Bdellovibrionales bacterium]|nr:hypothetical protein [Bdellovibrionales bacterium]
MRLLRGRRAAARSFSGFNGALLAALFGALAALALPAPRAEAGCATLEEMAERIGGLRAGTPLRVRSVRGNPYDGVVEGTFTAGDGRRIVVLRPNGGGDSVTLFLDQLDPASFTGPFEALEAGASFRVTSRSGNVYEGVFEGNLPDGSGGTRIAYRDASGRRLTLDRARLDEGSLSVARPVAPAHAVPAGFAEVPSATLPNGQAFALTGDASFLSAEVNGVRFPTRATRIWRDGSGALRVEAEILDPVTGQVVRRELTAAELGGARLSGTSQREFARTTAARRAGAPPPARAPDPLPPVPAERPATPPTAADRARHVSEAFPPGAPAHSQSGTMVSPRPTPRGARGNFVSTLADREYAVAAGRIFDDVSPATLSPGRYTYVITSDGRMSFGLVDDVWEFGSKHLNIANGRPVIAAGELQVTPGGRMSFNLESGTFTRHLIAGGRTSTTSMSASVEAVFAREVGSSNVQYVGESIFRGLRVPSAAELARLCASALFLLHNAAMCN